VLAAVDAAVMLLDAAKGLEPQTLKLFDVCRTRGIPVLTFVNKWDRPGREALELLDEVEQTIGLRPMPLTWPLGIAGHLRGLLEVATGEFSRLTRTAGGATRAAVEVVPAAEIAAAEPEFWSAAQDELALLAEIGAGFDEKDFLSGIATPVLFGAALSGVGVARLLDALVDLAPAPEARDDAAGTPRPLESPMSGLVFKVQAGMDRSHRDRMAFVRICSGRFERGMVLTHAGTKRPFATKYAQAVFGQQRTTLEEAFPGDIVGLVNAGALRPGDTLYAADPVEFPAIPSFAPEHFAVVRGADAGSFKQFRRGIEQLDSEGVIQVLVSDLRGDQAPVLAAVGPLQFEVVLDRLENEFRAPARLQHLDSTVTRRTDQAGADLLHGQSDVEVLTRRADGVLLAVFSTKWRLENIRRKFPDATLEPLPAGSVTR
jgi:peptide chain release factor 3